MLEVYVNGSLFTNLEEYSLSRSLDKNCGEFKIVFGEKDTNKIHLGDEVQFFSNGKSKLKGTVESERGKAAEDTFTVNGRDMLGDLIDSTVPSSAKVTYGGSLKGMCESIIKGLGLDMPVTQNVEIAGFVQKAQSTDIFGDTSEVQAADTSQKCMDFLNSFARKRNVYLLSSGDGGLVIYRPELEQAGIEILRTEGMSNVTDVEYEKSTHKRYNRYTVRSSDNVSDSFFEVESSAGVNRKGEYLDTEIRASRQLELNAEQSMNSSECKSRAEEEANSRNADSLVYAATLSGIQDIDIGQLVKTVDSSAKIEGLLLVRSVVLSKTKGEGAKTKVVLSLPESFQGRAKSAKDSRLAKTS